MDEKDNKLDRICVIDTHCGAGKTSYAIQYINQLPDDTRIIYITPRLTECERIRDSCPTKKFFAPDTRKGRGSKLVNFQFLISIGRNIASTHQLFSSITDEMIEHIRNNNYVLILDEVMDVVTKINLYEDSVTLKDEAKEELMKKDVKSLLSTGIIKVDDDYKVKWTSDEIVLNKYNKLKNLADRELLYLIGEDLIIWTFPVEVFRQGIFEQVFILTYMFDYQIQAYYYNYFEVPYTKYIVKETSDKVYDIFPMSDNMNFDLEWRQSISKLICICDNRKLNKIGSPYEDALGREVIHPLSVNWYKKIDTETLKILSSNIKNYLQNITTSKAGERMWTCFKDNEKFFVKNNDKLSKKNFIELNARAVNDFGNRDVLVYPINRNLNPFFMQFFAKKGITIDNDKYALSELIQWLFRSAIRNDKPIDIYIPSQRMREMLVDWLEGNN